ncbi:Fur family transcriptional regulator [uncultured Desulfobacter sp.]|uniref:Fur family transcriptional regulator n=1 Tax=uncultured Desulfobacter sp. TaxID=240139 RepID=UPI0029F5153A|nr:Fur family transcriptional regulator [uncultured Desulfobacter sp.]
MDLFYQKCKANKLKITPQRVAIYKVLTASVSHPSAEQIHREVKKQFPNISIDTVNRTLLTFAGAHMIDVVEGHGDPRRFDSNQTAHHHFYCVSCHKIFDFEADLLDRLALPPDMEKNFLITGKRVCLTGYCDQCRSKTADEKK